MVPSDPTIKSLLAQGTSCAAACKKKTQAFFPLKRASSERVNELIENEKVHSLSRNFVRFFDLIPTFIGFRTSMVSEK